MEKRERKKRSRMETVVLRLFFIKRLKRIFLSSEQSHIEKRTLSSEHVRSIFVFTNTADTSVDKKRIPPIY